jgi:type IV pilus assembly protein PilV
MTNNSSQSGYSLLEVLIALIILAIGLLGLAGLQMQGLRENNSSHLRSQATFLAADILDRMQANRAQALGGAYDIDLGTAPGMGGIVGQDLTAWKNALTTRLPSGDGSVDVNNGTAVVIIRWQDVSENGNFSLFRTDTRL